MNSIRFPSSSSKDSSASEDKFEKSNLSASLRKRPRGVVIGECESSDSRNENMDFNMFLNSNSICSQEDSGMGTFSQEMSERMTTLKFYGGSQDDSSVSYIRKPHFSPFKFHKNKDKQTVGTDNLEPEGRLERISAPIINPFLPVKDFDTWRGTELHRNLSDERQAPGFVKTASRFILPFGERPRYIYDFHQEDVLSTKGQFSEVFKARSRLDGCLYAVKKINKTSIKSENDSQLREVCALGVLQGCPNIIRYFSCWLQDGDLYIQTELCLDYTLEIYVDGIERKTVDLFTYPNDSYSSESGYDSQHLITPRYATDKYLDFADPENDLNSSGFVYQREAIPEAVALVVLRSVATALDFCHLRGE